jgi:hypothetical protein
MFIAGDSLETSGAVKRSGTELDFYTLAAFPILLTAPVFYRDTINIPLPTK